MGSDSEAAVLLTRRLTEIFEWYRKMVSDETGRLVYTYQPKEDVAVADGSPIRDIASVWDVALLSHFLQRDELGPLIRASLAHYVGYLVARDGALVVDADRLGEPSGIAHSAFLLLDLAESGLPGCDERIVGLAEGILRQQRSDGSYRIYFGPEEDEGAELYPGEAMLALMQAYARLHDARYVSSVERGFSYHREHFPVTTVSPDTLVFFANWQSQYAACLYAETHSHALRSAVRDYVFGLHDALVRSGFYEGIERQPMQEATVEIACALEGVNDAYAIAVRERDDDHRRSYERSIRIALSWLLRAQRLEGCTGRERGGFGHSLTGRTQRIDVTGHVVGGFIKSVRNQIAP